MDHLYHGYVKYPEGIYIYMYIYIYLYIRSLRPAGACAWSDSALMQLAEASLWGRQGGGVGCPSYRAEWHPIPIENWLEPWILD